jgi:L-fuconolactonase
MQQIIDTHIHVWDLNRAEYPWLKDDTSILNRTYTIEEIEEERKIAGITAGVLVQASGNLEDTHLMFDSAKRTDWIKGVVAWLPLNDLQKSAELLHAWSEKEKYFKGVRHQIHDETDTKWLLQPNVISTLKILSVNNIPYDLVGILPAHIETALEVAEKVPDLKMVFDHLNWPPIPTQEKFGKWGELMKQAAKHKNFYAKISGLGTASGNFENRTADDINPYVEFVLEHFGVEGCFCGSDWPVSLLANSYSGTWNVTKTLLNELLDEQDRNKVYFTNADKFYNLGLKR